MGITFSTEIMGHNKALFCRTYRQPMLIHWGYGLFTTNSHHPFGMQGLCLIVYRHATAIPSWACPKTETNVRFASLSSHTHTHARARARARAQLWHTWRDSTLRNRVTFCKTITTLHSATLTTHWETASWQLECQERHRTQQMAPNLP